MFLKRLELFGFKSFADRTVLDFERSLTGIVGPNGCGKSNVVDAIRWVLGEQRPTSMRGSEMSDVIFKGSASRPAMSVAEVTMVLDNSDETIEERGPEVAMTRRVFRSGEGEYLVDGDRVRLKDLRAMLFDTGLGSRGYAVLEQGKIDAVLSANPLDRRSIFEEAAGISRYRQQRSEVESRLRRVGQDTDRLDDVLRELKTRERSLKIQAGRAERYVEVRDAFRDKGADLARHQLHDLRRREGEADGSIEELGARTAELRGLRETAEREVASRDREQGTLSSAVDELTATTARVSGDLRALEERRENLSKRVRSLHDAAAGEEVRGEELAQRAAERRAACAELEAGAGTSGEALAKAEAGLAEISAELRELQGEAREARAASARQNETVLARLHEKTAAGNRLQHLEASLAPLTARTQRASERLGEVERNLAEARAAAEAIERERAVAETALDAEEQRRRTALERLEELRQRAESLRERCSRLELEQTRVLAQVESLRNRRREREDLEAGARRLLEGVEDGSAPLEAERLQGLLADHVAAPTRFARALDAVLGERAEAVVVDSGAGALEVVRWLKRGELGQVRLVVPGGLTGPGGARRASHPIPEAWRDRVLGRLGDLVQPAAGFEPLADLLLADVVVVERLEDALALAAAEPALRCVTPEGDLVDAAGVLGGHRAVFQGAVGRRAAAAELEARGEELGGELEATRAQFADLETEQVQVREELESAEAALEERRQDLARIRGAGDAARARRADLEQSAELYAAENASVHEEEQRLVGELEQTREALAAATSGFAEENARLQQLEERRAELDERCEERAREEYRARIDWTRQKEQAEGAARRLEDLLRSCDEADAEVERARELARTHKREALEGEEELERLADRRVVLLEERGSTEDRLRSLREREHQGREAIDEQRRRADAVTRELEDLQERLAALRLDAQRHELAIEELLRRAEEDFGLDEHALLDGFEPRPELLEPEALEALAAELHDLRHQLERLGPVNLEAVEELEEVSGRLGFLDEQRDDLARARRTLESTLERINDESERLFIAAFEEIRENFQRIFRQLFAGGRADVQLAPGEPVLEAGIDIIARPPGREMLPLGLLSGGQRTLTALALLFAVFQSRPSPFCVLDEVDAALDDANIGRFLGMLDGFRATTQFVLVTHNKGSMAACEILYGITMQTRGVSCHVSVELDEVDEFLPPDGPGSATAAPGASAQAADSPEHGEADVQDEPAAGGDAEDLPVVELRPGGAGVLEAQPLEAGRGD